MQCLTPITRQQLGQDLTMPCGQCHACRIRKREEWASRIMLESFGHALNWFVTLTYSDSNLPANGSICKRHPQLFMKRLRKRFQTEKIRYFCVGEYGSRTERPHYHFVLFGPRQDPTVAIEESWGRGFITCSGLTLSRARYVARYTTKKLTGPLSFSDGRLPEFATMSRRPGLGRTQALKIGQQLTQNGGWTAATPTMLKIGDQRILLDRYTRALIEQEIGQAETRAEIGHFRCHAKSPQIRRDAAEKGGQARSEELKRLDTGRARARDKL